MARFNRFYSSEILAARNVGELIELSGDEGHHLARVLRLNVGDTIELFDANTGWVGEVVSVGRNDAVIRLKAPELGLPLPARNLTMIIAPQKGDFDEIVVRLAELGVRRVIPVYSRYCEVDFSKRESTKLAERFQKLAIRAAKQCGINHMIDVEQQVSIEAACRLLDRFTAKFICDLRGQVKPIAQALPAEDPHGKRFAMAIGPEGGWAEDEAMQFIQAGFAPVQLPGGVLRSGTAAVAAASIVLSS